MFQELKFQLSTAILTLLTLASGVSAIINFQQQSRFLLPDDGVIWVDRAGGVQALDLAGNSAASRAGVRTGDVLVSINGSPIRQSIDVSKVLVRIGTWNKADYRVRRRGVEVKMPLIVAEAPRDAAVYYLCFVGFAYLAIGLFVYFKRGTAYKAQHFYIFCLVSFIFFTFHYTGKLNNFDKLIYWGNVVASLLAPVIFVHFCLSFPEPRKWLRFRVPVIALYGLAACMIAVYVLASSRMLRTSIPLVELRWMIDRMWLALITLIYILGGVALSLEYRKAEDPIVRRQLQWLRNGTFCRDSALRVVLCRALRHRVHSHRADEDRGAVVAIDPADSGLCHRAVPPDGRRHPVPARVCVYAGHAVRAGGFLRHHFLARQPGAEKLPGPGQHRADHRHAGGGVPVPADPQLDPGAAGPVLLPRPIRLPPHAGRVRARAEHGNRSRDHAPLGGRPADPDTLDPPSGIFPTRSRRRGGAAEVPFEDGRGTARPEHAADHAATIRWI